MAARPRAEEQPRPGRLFPALSGRGTVPHLNRCPTERGTSPRQHGCDHSPSEERVWTPSTPAPPRGADHAEGALYVSPLGALAVAPRSPFSVRRGHTHPT